MDRRRKRRVSAQLPVRVWGMDAKAQPFTQTAMVNNISRNGARVEGMLRMLKPGEFIHLQFGEDQAQYRVVWAGKVGTAREGEIGLEGLASEAPIWNVNLVHCSEFAGKG
ncbi:MAG: PilZ domain-containing protein [Acidobacteriia bacterium]|nr:PilZ domain-containing protein [Terriglobia bacterium]